MCYFKLFAGLMTGVVLVSGLLWNESRSWDVSILTSAELTDVWGGGTCYIDGTFSCGDAETSCPSGDCTRDPGTFEYSCYDPESPANKATMKTQPSYDHYATSDEGQLELTDPVSKPCNVTYTCGCDESGEEPPYPCSGDEEHRSGGTNGTMFNNQTPTGDTCPES